MQSLRDSFIKKMLLKKEEDRRRWGGGGADVSKVWRKKSQRGARKCQEVKIKVEQNLAGIQNIWRGEDLRRGDTPSSTSSRMGSLSCSSPLGALASPDRPVQTSGCFLWREHGGGGLVRQNESVPASPLKLVNGGPR